MPKAGLLDLKPYPEYKDSGVDWLGRVPKHWESRRLGSVLRDVVSREQPELPLLSVVRDKGVVLRGSFDKRQNHNAIPADLGNHKVVRSGEFAINKMKAWQGSYGVSGGTGLVSPAYFVFSMQGVEADYFHVAIRSQAYVPHFGRASDGVRVGQWDLSKSRMREILFVVPPRAEQQGIARVLDYVEAQLRRLIEAREEEGGLLEELKAATISEAVTGRIDVRTGQPYPAYKPSGIPWLGDIPAHWEVARANSRLESKKTVCDPRGIPDGKVVHYSIPNVQQFDRGIVEEAASIGAAKLLIDRPLVLVSKLNPRKGTIVLAEPDSKLRTLASSEFIAMAPVDCNADFATYLYKSEQVRLELSSRVESATRSHQRCSPDDVSKLSLAWPPLEEQEAIAEYLDRTICKIDTAIANTRREIELLEEYRTRLIADVVTGQVDVREAAKLIEAKQEAPQ